MTSTQFPVDLPLGSAPDPTIVLARAVDTDNPSNPGSAQTSFPDWVLTTQGGQKFVRIRGIGGLTSGHTYDITFAVF